MNGVVGTPLHSKHGGSCNDAGYGAHLSSLIFEVSRAMMEVMLQECSGSLWAAEHNCGMLWESFA